MDISAFIEEMPMPIHRFMSGLLSTSLLVPALAQAAPDIAAPAPKAAAPYIVQAAQEPRLSPEQMGALIRHHIKYVFVLYQENRSFDSYFGTFPGADGIYSRPAADTPGFAQPITGLSGTTRMISPFRIGPAQYAADTDDIDHAHPIMFAKMHVANGQAEMNRFALMEERKYWQSGAMPSLKAEQMGELAMAYEDCDTIPILWRYADRFVLMDHMFQDMIGPSTPGNLSIFAAQTGLTQWALHPSEAWKTASRAGVPVVDDQDPLWGSQADPYKHGLVPYNPKDYRKDGTKKAQIDQTYASLALTTAGKTVKAKTSHDLNPKPDLDDVKADLGFIQHLNRNKVAWRWFQEGFSSKPGPGNLGPKDAEGVHASYITHHNGPQYFGYISNNPQMTADMHGLRAFFTAVTQGNLPPEGGVFYIKGGYLNGFGMKPADPDAAVQKKFRGDDDHPGYSDSQISESLVARAVNAIAASKYWARSAIIITWDDSEGDYDHVPPPELARSPDGTRLSDGPRVPFMVISPYARVHHVSHAVGNQASVVKFVDAVFHLPPLATLPNEQKGRKAGEAEFHQKYMGPFDAETPGVTNLFSAFDPARLAGKAPPLPASYAEVSKAWAEKLPAQSGADCKAIGIVPTDTQLHIATAIPADFNPRPKTNPTRP
jgi:phospholipase C